jgi:hypothetical protein
VQTELENKGEEGEREEVAIADEVLFDGLDFPEDWNTWHDSVITGDVFSSTSHRSGSSLSTIPVSSERIITAEFSLTQRSE